MALGVIVIVSGVSAIVLDFFVERYVYESKKEEMTKLSRRVSQNAFKLLFRRELMAERGHGMMAGMSLNRVTDLIHDLEQILDVQIWLIDSKGQIYVEGNIYGREHLNKKEMERLASGRTLTYNNWKDEQNKRILVVASPMQYDNEFYGGFLVITPMEELYLMQTQIRQTLLFPTLLGGLVAVVLVFFFSKKLVKPIKEMQRLIQRMRQGDFSGQIEVQRDDELGQLTQHFNELSSDLDETINLLQNEQEQTQRIINSMAEGVISLNCCREVVVINPAARKILGIRSEDTDVWTFICNLPEIEEQITKVEEEKRSLVREIEGDGQVLLSIASPIIAGEDQALGVVVVLQDITQRWRLIQMQKDLVANVSHEFKTPLTSIRGFVELLLDQKITDVQSLEGSLKIIHSETLRLIRMVNDLLGLARLEHLRLEKQLYVVEELVQEVSDSLSLRQEENGVGVEIDPSLKGVQVYVDKDRMEQVFYNILDNAIRFSPEGSNILVKGAESEDVVELQIRDQGPGIPESEHEMIFDRFYKIEKARSTNKSGTGLGLAIVKNIVEEHGGKIWVENHPDGGAVFMIRLNKV